ncbi:cytochrome c oxidase subunit II [Govanella unica]|uniref:Cytochrome c oxidase subunit 2 n=1 Tax=Govanella unica TaxID=2975056 RepID=A0A9X3TX38_9PROT|nr:cytochrome c oxidase subunit II [Govania unica]MDA5193348.1 cytochrome c oxidase subunit II [Govania unica]
MGSLSGAVADEATRTLPHNWQMYYQPAVTEVMRDVEKFHTELLVIIAAITLLVSALIIYVAVRFNRKANPVPSKTTHNTTIEVIWTLIPVLILVFIAIPSFKLLYLQDRIPTADVTVKAIGNQWYWSYEYPDHEGLGFDANMLSKAEAMAQNKPYLFAADAHVVVPVNKIVRVLVTASDVVHAWAVPAFGVKIDAVPGRLNETWFRAEKEGIYYGQCSELCGNNHAFMPIVVEVVSEAKYAAWLEHAKGGVASNQTAAGDEVAALAVR